MGFPLKPPRKLIIGHMVLEFAEVVKALQACVHRYNVMEGVDGKPPYVAGQLVAQGPVCEERRNIFG